MDANIWIIISVVLAAAVIILAAMLFTQRRRSGQLQKRFGPEYERTVSRHGSQKEAEEELIARERRVTRFRIVPLSREDAARFSEDWRAVQNRFVDDPKAAVEDLTVMKDMVATFSDERKKLEQQWEHGDKVSTEDLRLVLRRYRSFFDRFLSI